MNGKERKRGKKSRKTNKRFRQIIWAVLIFAGILAAGGAVSVDGMEYGGFDVDIGSGESWEYPSDWESSQGNNGQGDSIQGNSSLWDSSQWDYSQWDDYYSGENVQNNPYLPYEGDTQGNYYAPYEGGGQVNPYGQPGSYGQMDIWQGQTLYPQEDQMWTGQPETQQWENQQSVTRHESETEQNTSPNENTQAAGNQEESTNVPAEPTPSVKPKPTSVPSTAEGKRKLTPTPVPNITASGRGSEEDSHSFTYYNKRKEREEPADSIDDSIIFFHEKQPPRNKLPEVQVKAQGAVQILSIHYNGRECSWHWEDDTIVLEEVAGEKENSIEILAVTEKGKLAVMKPWIF
ncbi:MAG: hypothetical protein Q4D16_03160 [Eubacteriales bacterium]|nr:hypothetical protein [Eubacteriales bacterium]